MSASELRVPLSQSLSEGKDGEAATVVVLPITVLVLVVVQQACATRHTSHVTRHTSHVTRHTSHVTRHTSHVTSRVQCDGKRRVDGKNELLVAFAPIPALHRYADEGMNEAQKPRKKDGFSSCEFV